MKKIIVIVVIALVFCAVIPVSAALMKASKNDFVNIYETNKQAAEVKVTTINTQFSTNNK